MTEEYRELLQRLENESQQSYDKAVMTLSGGALAVSFAFVKDFVPLEGANSLLFLIAAWIAWGLSLAATLLSHFFSTYALRSMIKAEDSGEREPSPGWLDSVTGALNFISGALFVTGVLLLAFFVYFNIGISNV